MKSDLTYAQQLKIASIAKTDGWQVAMHDHMRTLNHAEYRMAIDEYGSQLRFLLPIEEESKVLVIQCGWGALAFNLATCAECVVTMDYQLTKLRFVTARQQQMNIKTLYSVQGEKDFRFPFASESFDAVVMLDGVAKNVQRSALAEVRRVLRKSGYLLWGVFNRLSFIRLQVGSSQKFLTYWGYIQNLRIKGFSDLQCYAALPSHYEPYFIVPVGKFHLLDYLIDSLFASQEYQSKAKSRGLGWAYDLAHTLWPLVQVLRLSAWASYLLPSYLIVAH
jgi:ubiquinone/menaquinone biosynthesis C-methylase UbiE